MATLFYYGRRRYGRSRYARRSYRRAYSTYSRSQRRATRNQRAALQQRDQSEVVLNVPSKLECFSDTITINSGTTSEEAITTGGFALNIWDLLRKSEFYQSYANMYDQVKINKISVRLTPFQFPIVNNYGNGITNYYSSYTIITAWDRTGLSEEQMKLNFLRTDANKKQNIIGGIADSNGLFTLLDGKAIGTYSSAIQRNVNPNSSTATLTRTIYPSSISEKGYWVNTSDLRTWYGGYDSEHGRFYGIEFPQGVATASIQADSDTEIPDWPIQTIVSRAVAKNPAFLLETPEVPFKPTLLVGMLNEPVEVQYPSGDPSNPVTTSTLVPRMKFNVEADVVVSFRGLRKANIVQ